ncbi:MAG TPA: tRNA (guanosine(46)-N7)-methyltransferase TrmB [Phycisphaerales bacterium]|nr:tRNA (guanosine(46)-N7)-methyltransferase TrmB [Phycisphaerales bacterium]HRQ75877.1 tRNA (guanosine(46)-N7)-methyltransferase TrmB [Phycisphaerales bacterium]
MSFGLSRGKTLDVTGFGIDQSELPPFDRGRLDPRMWFAHPERRFEIEIGSGKGTFLVQQAALQPEVNFLGCEWAAEFYRYAADRLRRRNLTNVKMLRADATEFLRFWCADEVAAVVHLYFSDPWPKKRHHKRRVVQDHTLVEFHRVLQQRGELRIVTDHDDLWAWCEEHAARHTHLFDRVEFDRPTSAGEAEVVGTNFERKYAREGRPFHAMTLVKRGGDSLC